MSIPRWTHFDATMDSFTKTYSVSKLYSWVNGPSNSVGDYWRDDWSLYRGFAKHAKSLNGYP